MLLPSEICKKYTFFHTSLGCHKNTVGDGEKLLTYLNSALKAPLGFDIFPRVPKQSEILATWQNRFFQVANHSVNVPFCFKVNTVPISNME